MYILLFIVYLLCIMLYCLKINSKVYAGLAVILLSIITYFYNPLTLYYSSGVYVDTVRMFYEMDMINMGNEAAVDGVYASSPLSWLYLVFFSQLENNNLMPSFSVGLGYSIYFYSCHRLKEKFQFPNNTCLYMILFILAGVSFFNLATNIRQPLVFAVAFFVMICDYFGKISDKYVYVFFFILMLFHPVGILFILVKLLSHFKLKYSLSLIFLFLAVLSTYLDNIIITLVGLGLEYTDGLVWKISGYTESGNNLDMSVSTIGFHTLLLLLFFILTLLIRHWLSTDLKKEYTYFFRSAYIFMGISILSYISYFLYHSEMYGRIDEIFILYCVYYFVIIKVHYACFFKLKSKILISIFNFIIMISLVYKCFHYIISFYGA